MQSKSWSKKYHPNVHHRDNKRFSVTIFGAISEALEGKFVYMLGGGTTAKEYQQFLRLCKGKVRSDLHQKVVWLYDGAPAHTSEASLKICK